MQNHHRKSPHSSNNGVNAVNRARRALRRERGRKLRSAAPRHQQKPDRGGQAPRPPDHNHNPSTASPANKPALGTQPAVALSTPTALHLNQESKKEVTSGFVLANFRNRCLPPGDQQQRPFSDRLRVLPHLWRVGPNKQLGFDACRAREGWRNAAVVDSHAGLKPTLWFYDARSWQVVQKSQNSSICTLLLLQLVCIDLRIH